MTPRNLPTRTDIETAITAEVGHGRPAMEAAVAALKATFTDMTNELVDKICDDLLSYPVYANEQ